jgi:hypothetical protein
METVLHEINKGLKQNLAIHDYNTWHRLNFQTQFWRTELFKKSVNNLGTNYLKSLENSEPFKKQIRAFLLQQTFYLVDEYLSYMQAPWKGILWKSMEMANKLLLKLVVYGRYKFSS